MADAGDTPRMPYWHVYTDADGVSRQAQFHMTAFDLQSVGDGAQPQWNDKMTKS